MVTQYDQDLMGWQAFPSSPSGKPQHFTYKNIQINVFKQKLGFFVLKVISFMFGRLQWYASAMKLL